jgi:5-hydroxyisourate hydrolase
MITTHVLDTSRGRPAAGVRVILERQLPGTDWQMVGQGVTDADGRLGALVAQGSPAPPGVYRLLFDTGAYFAARQVAAFYPHVTITFEVAPHETHYHVPLLLGPYGYTTYRGS